MLRLALEIPTSLLPRLAPQADLDFILAHKVLADKDYASFFKHRPLGRELILDNSTHEFGKPLPLFDLLRAAGLCNADYVVAPDIVNPSIDSKQVEQNMQWLADTCGKFVDSHHDIGCVLCGTTPAERNLYIQEAAIGAQMMMFTFHDPRRLEWWGEFQDHEDFAEFERCHILGVSSLDEMKTWVGISEDFAHLGSMYFSIDTTKAVKWGAQMKEIDKLESLRGGPIDAKAVLELDNFTEEQIQCIEYNINILKRICAGKF